MVKNFLKFFCSRELLLRIKCVRCNWQLHIITKVSNFEMTDSWQDDMLLAKVQCLKGCHLNLAMCFLKLKNFNKCVENASNALDLDPANPKALYRRACAALELQEFDQAAADIRELIKADPANKEVFSFL